MLLNTEMELLPSNGGWHSQYHWENKSRIFHLERQVWEGEEWNFKVSSRPCVGRIHPIDATVMYFLSLWTGGQGLGPDRGGAECSA